MLALLPTRKTPPSHTPSPPSRSATAASADPLPLVRVVPDRCSCGAIIVTKRPPAPPTTPPTPPAPDAEAAEALGPDRLPPAEEDALLLPETRETPITAALPVGGRPMSTPTPLTALPGECSPIPIVIAPIPIIAPPPPPPFLGEGEGRLSVPPHAVVGDAIADGWPPPATRLLLLLKCLSWFVNAPPPPFAEDDGAGIRILSPSPPSLSRVPALPSPPLCDPSPSLRTHPPASLT